MSELTTTLLIDSVVKCTKVTLFLLQLLSVFNETPHVFGSGLQVQVYNLMQYEHGADDVLVMGTDGLWDVLSNQEVAESVTTFLANCDPDDLHRSAACFLFISVVA